MLGAYLWTEGALDRLGIVPLTDKVVQACMRQVMESLAQWTAGGLLAQPQARAAVLGLFAALGAALHGGARRLARLIQQCVAYVS